MKTFMTAAAVIAAVMATSPVMAQSAQDVVADAVHFRMFNTVCGKYLSPGLLTWAAVQINSNMHQAYRMWDAIANVTQSSPALVRAYCSELQTRFESDPSISPSLRDNGEIQYNF